MRLNRECDTIVDYLYQDGTHTIFCTIRKAKHISGLSNETHRPTGLSGPPGGYVPWLFWSQVERSGVTRNLLTYSRAPVESSHWPAGSRDLAIWPESLQISEPTSGPPQITDGSVSRVRINGCATQCYHNTVLKYGSESVNVEECDFGSL